MKIFLLPLLALISGFLFAETTPVQTTTYQPGELYDFDELVDGLGSIYLYGEEPVTGLQKFDPALGELEEIRITVTGSALLQVNLTSDSIEDESAPFTALFDPGFEEFANIADVGLVYSPTGRNIGFSVATDSIEAPTVGLEEEDPDFWTFDSFYFEDYTEEEFFLYDGEDEPALETTLDPSDPDFNPSDFIGGGEVTGLSFFGYGEFDTTEDTITLENLSQASLDIYLSYSEGEISLQYVYRPAGPEITSYTIEGALHRITFTHDPGLAGWRLRGGSDPSSLDNDHTGVTDFIESEPGIYQATVNLPDLIAEKYFLAIARPDSP